MQTKNGQVSLKELQCKNLIKGETQNTKTKCGNDEGNIINIGYNVAEKNWITLIKVCYNSTVGNTLFSEHTLYGEVIKCKYAIICNIRLKVFLIKIMVNTNKNKIEFRYEILFNIFLVLLFNLMTSVVDYIKVFFLCQNN